MIYEIVEEIHELCNNHIKFNSNISGGNNEAKLKTLLNPLSFAVKEMVFILYQKRAQKHYFNISSLYIVAYHCGFENVNINVETIVLSPVVK